MAEDFLTAFLGALPLERRPPAQPREVGERLACALDEARARWPDVEVPAEVFLPYLARRLPSVDGLLEALDSVRVSDLYLAAACAVGVPEAVEAFETAFVSRIDPALAKLRLQPTVIEEVKQAVRERLLVGDGERGPRISEYAGRGDLYKWLRVIAVREALEGKRRVGREVPLEEDALLEISTASDPEVDYFRSLYREEFRTAFEEALGALTPLERNLLRHNVIDRLSIDRIAALYRTHRSTAARRLAKARQRLLSETRERLARRLQVSEATFESIMRMVHTHLHLSVRRYLKEGSKEGTGSPPSTT